MANENSNIPLSEMIEMLRVELAKSIENAKDKDLQFLIDGVEVELKVAVTNDVSVGGGVKFWVINAKASQKVSQDDIHSFKLKLKPVLASGGGIRVSDKDEELGDRP